MPNGNHMTGLLAAALWLAATAVAAPAAAQMNIGEALKVVNVVEGALQGEVRRISVADDVRRDEVITTGADSATEIAFADGSTLSIGANSRLVLDEFAYDPDADAADALVTLGTGAFRFVTEAAEGARNYVFKTPTATIGIRGTTIEVLISRTGATTLRGIRGLVSVTAGNRTVNVSEGTQTTVNPGEPPSEPAPLEPAPAEVQALQESLEQAEQDEDGDEPAGETQEAEAQDEDEDEGDEAAGPDQAGETQVAEQDDGSVIVTLPDGTQVVIDPALAQQISGLPIAADSDGADGAAGDQLESGTTQGGLDVVLNLEFEVNQEIAVQLSEVAPAAGPGATGETGGDQPTTRTITISPRITPIDPVEPPFEDGDSDVSPT